MGSIGPDGYYTDFRLSPDEKSLAASLLDARTSTVEVWITDLARGATSRIGLAGTVLNASPIWSPDGAQFVFRTNRGTVDLYRRSAAGGNEQIVLPHQMLRTAGIQSNNLVDTDWSPDGNSILFSISTSPSSGTDLWLLPLTGDKKPVKYLTSAADEMHGNFSPDGRLIAYTSNESGRFQVNVQTLPLSDKKSQVSTNGGYEPRWRADGREIYYLKIEAHGCNGRFGPSFGVLSPCSKRECPLASRLTVRTSCPAATVSDSRSTPEG
jgi:Tol biopolymer transport system component